MTSQELLGCFLCFVYRASLHNPFQMKPTRCALLLSIFISTSLSGLQTRQSPIQSDKYQCRIDTVSSPDDCVLGFDVLSNGLYTGYLCTVCWVLL